jgi:hypothetical protein
MKARGDTYRGNSSGLYRINLYFARLPELLDGRSKIFIIFVGAERE